MEPAVSTKGKVAQLRYELPHRVHDVKVYPVKAPNGSSITIYGHENGVRILWRGGRPPKPAAPPKAEPAKPRKANGASADVIMIDDSDDEAPPAKSTKSPVQQPEEDEFESEEEELDPDAPFPSFVRHLDLSLSAEAFHIAVPQIPAVSALRPTDSVPAIFSSRIVFSVACADYSVRIITLPLNPPSAAKRNGSTNPHGHWGEQIIKITGHQSIPKGIAMTWTSSAEPTLDEEEAEEEMDVDEEEDSVDTPRLKSRRRQNRSGSAHGSNQGWDLLLASHSAELGGLLRIWRFAIGGDESANSIEAVSPVTAYQTVYLQSSTSKIAFNIAQYPKRRHSQLLIADVSGTARIYDPFAPISRRSRNSSTNQETGTFTTSFRTSFEDSKDSSSAVPMLARRKPILDAAWAADGRSIVTLLGDGEWGIWDIDRSGPNPPMDPTVFSLRGFVGSATAASHSVGSATPKKRDSTRSSLAPMTPNTRRGKEDSLFHVASSTSSAPRGGVVISTLQSTTGGAPEDSVIIWYGNEIYRIPKLGQYWSRSTTGGSGGSVLGAGLARIPGLPLRGEAITAVDQFETTVRESRLAIPRDVVVTAEHRLIITTNTSAQTGQNLNAAFAKARDEEAVHRRVDQALLESGELDLGGMDRLLEEMGGNEEQPKRGGGLTMGNPRKVLFASSTN